MGSKGLIFIFRLRTCWIRWFPSFHVLLRKNLIQVLNIFIVCLMEKSNIKDYRIDIFLPRSFTKSSPREDIYCQINFVYDGFRTSHNRDIKKVLVFRLRHDLERTADERLQSIFLHLWFIYWEDQRRDLQDRRHKYFMDNFSHLSLLFL